MTAASYLAASASDRSGTRRISTLPERLKVLNKSRDGRLLTMALLGLRAILI